MKFEVACFVRNGKRWWRRKQRDENEKGKRKNEFESRLERLSRVLVSVGVGSLQLYRKAPEIASK
jgi:hypothetical protein